MEHELVVSTEMALRSASEPAGVELRRGVDLSLRCPRAQTEGMIGYFIEQGSVTFALRSRSPPSSP